MCLAIYMMSLSLVCRGHHTPTPRVSSLCVVKKIRAIPYSVSTPRLCRQDISVIASDSWLVRVSYLTGRDGVNDVESAHCSLQPHGFISLYLANH